MRAALEFKKGGKESRSQDASEMGESSYKNRHPGHEYLFGKALTCCSRGSREQKIDHCLTQR